MNTDSLKVYVVVSRVSGHSLGEVIECFTSLGCILVVSSVCLRGKMLITFDEIVNFVILIHEVNV